MVDINQTLSTLPDDATLPHIKLDPTLSCPVHDPIQPIVDPKRYETTLSSEPVRKNDFDLIKMGTPQRPTVPKETSCTLYAALLSYIRFEKGQSRELSVFKTEIDFDMKEIERREKEFAALVKEATQQQETTSTWSTASNIINYFATPTSLVSAVVMALAGNYLAAGLLIASAGLGLANLIIRDTIGWDTVAKYFSSVKETQEKLELNMQIGFTVVALGLGVAGAFSQMGQMALLIDRNALSTMLNTGIYLARGSVDFGTAFQDRKFEHIKAQQVQLRQELQAKQAKASSKNNDIAEDFRRSQTQASLLQQLISSQQSLIST